jgi:hypothetical protein
MHNLGDKLHPHAMPAFDLATHHDIMAGLNSQLSIFKELDCICQPKKALKLSELDIDCV